MALRPSDWLGGVGANGDAVEAAGVHQRLLALCGFWRDQKGSVYHLFPASAHSLHVHTTRPSAHHRFTAHLVRLVQDRDQPRVFWGAGRYTLACGGGLDAIIWRGRSEADHYDWIRFKLGER